MYAKSEILRRREAVGINVRACNLSCDSVHAETFTHRTSESSFSISSLTHPLRAGSGLKYVPSTLSMPFVPSCVHLESPLHQQSGRSSDTWTHPRHPLPPTSPHICYVKSKRPSPSTITTNKWRRRKLLWSPLHQCDLHLCVPNPRARRPDAPTLCHEHVLPRTGHRRGKEKEANGTSNL